MLERYTKGYPLGSGKLWHRLRRNLPRTACGCKGIFYLMHEFVFINLLKVLHNQELDSEKLDALKKEVDIMR